MSASKCVTVIAGTLDDQSFAHMCFIARSLTNSLPNFHFKSICKISSEWKSWLQKICTIYGWSHAKSPLVWREIGITGTNVTYIGGAYQFWELLHKHYNISSYLTKEDLDNLQSDLYVIRNAEQTIESLKIKEKRRQIMIIGAGRSVCSDLVPQLIMTEELWLLNGIVVKLYDEPGHYFKVKKIAKDVEGIGGGLRAATVSDSIPNGLYNSDILIYLDTLSRGDCEEVDDWLHRNYTVMKSLAEQINQYAPRHMKVIFCSMGPTCFCADVMKFFVTKLPTTNIVTVSAHYGLEVMYSFVTSLGFDVQGFGCPPVWGYLGINQFVDVCHMVHKYDVYKPNKKAVANRNPTLSYNRKHSELRWFFYTAHDKDPYKYYFRSEALAQYQLGRTEDFQKCRAICDLLKLWYSNKNEIGNEIISLGITSDGTFNIPKGLTFSQPVYLQVLEDNSRIWVPFSDFPMPNMPISIFKNLIDTAVIIKRKMCTK